MSNVTLVGTVGTGHNESTLTGTTIAATRNGIVAGNTVVVAVGIEDATSITNVSDGTTTVTTPDLIFDWVGGTQKMAFFSFPNHAGGNKTFTATFGASQTFRSIVIVELTPCVFDKGSGTSGNSATPTAPSVTPASDGCYILGWCWGNTIPATAGGFTDLLSDTINTTDLEGLAQTTAAAIAPSWTMTSGIWGAISASYMPVGNIDSGGIFDRAAQAYVAKNFFSGRIFAVAGPQSYNQSLFAGLSFSGSIGNQTGKPFAAGLTFVGAFVKQTNKVLSGGLSFVGSFLKQTGKALTGGLTFVGAFVKQTNKVLSGGLSFSGAFIAAHVFLKSLTGGLSFSGAFTKQTSKPFSGGLTFSGAFVKQTNKVLAGGLTFVGAFTKQANKILAGGLSFGGVFTKQTGKALTGGLSFSGSFLKQAGKKLTGGLSFSGNLLKQTNKVLAGGLSFVGSLLANRVKLLTLAGGLSFSGSLSNQTGKQLAAGLSFAGALAKQCKKQLTGGLSFVGSLAAAHTFTKAFTAGLTFVGSFSKQTKKSLVGWLYFNYANLALWSEDFTNGVWAVADVTITPNQGTSPDGQNNATKVTTKGLSGLPYFRQLIPMLVGESCMRAIHAKADTSNIVVFEWLSSAWVNVSNPTFHLDTGTITGGNTTDDAITAVPGFPGWYRLSSRRIAKITNPGMAFFTDVYGTDTVAGQSVLYWGASLDYNVALGPYLKTTNATVSDSLSLLTKRTTKILIAALSFVGGIAKQTRKKLTAGLSFAGSFVRQLVVLILGAIRGSPYIGPLLTGTSKAQVLLTGTSKAQVLLTGTSKAQVLLNGSAKAQPLLSGTSKAQPLFTATIHIFPA